MYPGGYRPDRRRILDGRGLGVVARLRMGTDVPRAARKTGTPKSRA
ncbi:hypothetical protein VSR34_17085 [Paraburkholderia sp. JHI2823]|nr:hypothetical protein [Paraburkholderia mimosarum]